jgi:hypothetical protein
MWRDRCDQRLEEIFLMPEIIVACGDKLGVLRSHFRCVMAAHHKQAVREENRKNR